MGPPILYEILMIIFSAGPLKKKRRINENKAMPPKISESPSNYGKNKDYSNILNMDIYNNWFALALYDLHQSLQSKSMSEDVTFNPLNFT